MADGFLPATGPVEVIPVVPAVPVVAGPPGTSLVPGLPLDQAVPLAGGSQVLDGGDADVVPLAYNGGLF